MHRAVVSIFESRARRGRGVLRRCMALVAISLFSIFASAGFGGTLDAIGVTQLRAVNPSLTGAGVNVAQPEATSFTGNTDNNNFEVRPSAVGKPTTLFTYINSSGATATTFPNGVGSESGHADSVAANFYGATTGVAPGVAHVDNYNANYFVNGVIASGATISATVINQSFISSGTTTQNAQLDSAYDNYAVFYNKLFVSGVGNSGGVNSPATMYNGIGVAAYGGASSIGPTANDGDNLRSKPDITAPASATSFSTPLVAGSAALLYQAAASNPSLSDASSTHVSSALVIKALLLDGAVHPAGWTNTPTAPLDARYGAGIVNVYTSYEQLIAGEHHFNDHTVTSSVGGAHLPSGALSNVSAIGWDSNTITSNGSSDSVNHYFFNESGAVTFKSTLDWNRVFDRGRDQINGNPTLADINHLFLYLYNVTNPLSPVLVASSISNVDNVQYLSALLAPGRYDLEVLAQGGAGLVNGGLTPYALAYVPEPGSAVLLGLGALGLLLAGRRRAGHVTRS